MKKNFVKTLIMAMAVTAMVGTTGITTFAAETATTTQTTKQTLNASVVAKVFDAAYYAEKNPDVVAVVGTDANALLNHYIQCGIYEGRDASATFNADAYLSANTDLATVFGNNLEAAIEHYEQFGVNENRIATVTGATAAGITVTSATNPELVIATPAPKMTKGTSYSGGGSSSSSGSSVSGGSSSDSSSSLSSSSNSNITTYFSSSNDSNNTLPEPGWDADLPEIGEHGTMSHEEYEAITSKEGLDGWYDET